MIAGFDEVQNKGPDIGGNAGDPVVFVLTREGLRWKLSDIRLPPP